MVAKDGTITVSLTIGKHDQDIADWFNMLRREGQSKSMWASALVMAYDKGVALATGYVTTFREKSETASSASQNSVHSIGNRRQTTDALLFGTGRIKSKPYRHDSGWGNRGANGEYIIGSTITLRLTNREVIKTYWKLVGEGYHISTLIKYALRAGLRYGEADVPPNPDEAKNLLTFPPFKHLKPPEKPYQPSQAASEATENRTIAANIALIEKTSGRKPKDAKTRNPLLDYI